MDISQILSGMLADSSELMLAVLVFLATTVLTLGIMLTVRARGAVKRRAAAIAAPTGDGGECRGLRRSSSLKAVQRLLDYTTKHYGTTEKNKGEMKVLRRRLIQAGIFDERGVGYFFVARTALAVTLALVAFFLVPMIVVLK